eukprot:GHVR01181122.1.p1 GENE.GHVR01181122.1~~GHVR01181122.1.p1  ORF type:complete len:222 (+),score=83.24 GHVR01181122.1:272-937(+)
MSHKGISCQTRFMSWFYFSIQNVTQSETITIHIRRLNLQTKLYQQGMRPVVRVLPHKPMWTRIESPVSYTVDGEFRIKFTHTFQRDGKAYFAFCYPFSYAHTKLYLDILDYHYSSEAALPPWPCTPEEFQVCSSYKWMQNNTHIHTHKPQTANKNNSDSPSDSEDSEASVVRAERTSQTHTQIHNNENKNESDSSDLECVDTVDININTHTHTHTHIYTHT